MKNQTNNSLSSKSDVIVANPSQAFSGVDNQIKSASDVKVQGARAKTPNIQSQPPKDTRIVWSNERSGLTNLSSRSARSAVQKTSSSVPAAVNTVSRYG